MNINVRKFNIGDINEAIDIWNSVVDEGMAFPQTEILTKSKGKEFFKAQSYVGIAEDADSSKIVGLYILHPNGIGRCSHICNASYAVEKGLRGQKVGEALVIDCMKEAKMHGFLILQFNAVVKSNTPALHLYEKLGFTKLGTIPKGFLNKKGKYEDIIPHYRVL